MLNQIWLKLIVSVVITNMLTQAAAKLTHHEISTLGQRGLHLAYSQLIVSVVITNMSPKLLLN
jgi:hypothetical protein